MFENRECICCRGYSVLFAHGDKAASPLVRLLEGEKRREAPDHLQDVLPQNWGGIKLNLTVPCIRLTTGVHLACCREEFREPRSEGVSE
ncbi:hypothetical protein TNCV_1210751 [Trichonephila clavipes]|nr:hypothetical protein TNCV_1210751 [Trichonephila clavipes]